MFLSRLCSWEFFWKRKCIALVLRFSYGPFLASGFSSLLGAAGTLKLKDYRLERPRCHNTLLFITLAYESALNCHGREAMYRLHDSQPSLVMYVHCDHGSAAICPPANILTR